MIISYKHLNIILVLMLIFLGAEAEEVYFDLSEDNIEKTEEPKQKRKKRIPKYSCSKC
mgnify:CR=1 FL=1